MPDFIPRADDACLSWSRNFAQRVGNDYERYRVRASAAAEVVATQADFAQALQIARSPGSNSDVARQKKRDARKAMERVIRSVAGSVRTYLRLNDRVKLIELGLDTGPGPYARRRKIGTPQSEPIVFVRKVEGARVTVQLCDTVHGGRGKPRDVSAAVIFTSVAPKLSSDQNAWRVHKMTSRTRVTLDFGNDFAPGAIVWIVARWETRTGKRGKFGRAVYARLNYPEVRFGNLNRRNAA